MKTAPSPVLRASWSRLGTFIVLLAVAPACASVINPYQDDSSWEAALVGGTFDLISYRDVLSGNDVTSIEDFFASIDCGAQQPEPAPNVGQGRHGPPPGRPRGKPQSIDPPETSEGMTVMLVSSGLALLCFLQRRLSNRTASTSPNEPRSWWRQPANSGWPANQSRQKRTFRSLP